MHLTEDGISHLRERAGAACGESMGLSFSQHTRRLKVAVAKAQ